MSKPKLPDTATPLWHWMARHGATLEALAALLDISPNYLSDIRRGKHRPSDDLKLAIERVTRAWEAKAGSAKPRGVKATVWLQGARVVPSPNTR